MNFGTGSFFALASALLMRITALLVHVCECAGVCFLVSDPSTREYEALDGGGGVIELPPEYPMPKSRVEEQSDSDEDKESGAEKCVVCLAAVMINGVVCALMF